MRRIAALLLTILTAAPGAAAQWVHRGALESIEQRGQPVRLGYERAAVELHWLESGIVRVRVEAGPIEPLESFARAPTTWPGVQPTVDGLSIRTDGIGVDVRDDGRLVFRRAGGEPFLVEDARSTARRADGRVSKAWFRMPADEQFFGLGEKSGPVDRRGSAFAMWNTDAYYYGSGTDPLYQSIPFFVAIRGGRAYGVFLDAPERSFFDFGRTERDAFSFGAHSSRLDYYVIDGPTPKDVIRRYTALTGRIALPPKWALGYQQCRYSYYPDRRVREIAKRFRDEKIPCDVIWLDIDYMDGFRCFTWDKGKFPNPKGLIASLRADGFATVVMIDPGIKAEEGYFVYDQGVAGDHFVKKPDGSIYTGRVWPGQCAFPDFHRAETREWWGGLYADLLDLGVAGVWNDMNEPSVFDGPEGTMPLDVVHRVRGEPVDHAYAHNTYGMQMVRATHDGIARLRPDKRPFVLTRAAYAGSQRWAAGWTGDNRSYWEHLEQSVPMVVNWSISGHAFTGPDVGGFTGSPSPELLVRWTQVGALLPLFRNHTSKNTRDQEPWVHGEPYTSANRKAIELRYRLLPYLYSLFRECAETGVPIARLPLLDYPEWTGSTKPWYQSQFLLGDALFVSPVTRIGETRWPVSPPPDTWYDFDTGARCVSTGGRLTVDAPLDRIPIFARAGSVIPMQSVVQHVGEAPDGPLVLRCYPGPKRAFPFYEDDGDGYAYRDGAYRLTALTATFDGDDAVVRVESIDGTWGARPGPVRVEVWGVDDRPKGVTVRGTPVRDWRYDDARGCVIVDADGLDTSFEVRVSGAR